MSTAKDSLGLPRGLLSEKRLTDMMVFSFSAAMERVDISYDDFIQTTEKIGIRIR